MNLKQHIFSYTGVNILNASVPFLLLPILTAYLNPSEYGLLSMIQLLMVVSLPIVLMNTFGLLMMEYTELTSEKFQSLVSTIVWIPMVGFLFLEILFYIFSDYIVQYFHIPINYLYIIPIFVLLQSIPSIVPIIYQAKKEPFNFGKYKISMTIINLSLSILFVVIFSFGWEGRIYGIVGSFLIFTIIGFVILSKSNFLKFSLDKELLESALKFGIPLIPHSIAGTFLVMSDRIFLVNMLGGDSVGIYSVAFQVSTAIAIIMGSINQAWAPHLFEMLNSNPTIAQKKQIVKTTYKIMGVMTGITFIFILCSSFIFDIFINSNYHEGKVLSKYIAIAFLFQGFYFMVTNYIFYTKKTYILSVITVSSLIIVVIANYFFIKSYGILGSVYAMVLIWIIFFLITWYISNKLYKMPWRLR